MKKIILLILIIELITFSALAHSGRTDANGGHWNHATGEYHYHNGGYVTQPSYDYNYNATYYNNSTNYNSDPNEIKSIEIVADDTYVQLDESAQLSCVGKTAGGDSINLQPKWESNNLGVLRVLDDGTIVPLSIGDAEVECRAEGLYDSITIHITKIENMTKRNPDYNYINIIDLPNVVNYPYVNELEVEPKYLNDDEITWKSSNNEVLMVDDSGMIIAVGYGTATITAKSPNGDWYSQEVRVEESVESIREGIPWYIFQPIFFSLICIAMLIYYGLYYD